MLRQRVTPEEIAGNIKPAELFCPLSADSSQLAAVLYSAMGKSFVLHGPPGTGKSQTITNMIANALFQGKRVLFVAEKMAALSVVQSRLEKIGLAPFCLELHSNKVTKKHFLEQMDLVLNVKKINAPRDFLTTSQELYAERLELIAYMEALHQKGTNGLSLYDCISEYLLINEEEMDDVQIDMTLISPDYISQILSQSERIDTILQITGRPGNHPLAGLEPVDNKTATFEEIKALLTEAIRLRDLYAQQKKELNAVAPFCVNSDADVDRLLRLLPFLNPVRDLNANLLEIGADKALQSRLLRIINQGRACDKQRQKLIDEYIKKTDEMIKAKEEEIMTV